jgi:hypothetical protein
MLTQALCVAQLRAAPSGVNDQLAGKISFSFSALALLKLDRGAGQEGFFP